jgi:hypothetical protein
VKLLLTVLSVLAAWTLHGVLLAGLLSILRPLEQVRRYLRRITMGVRAIEQQTAPLAGHAQALIGTLGETSGATAALARQLTAVDRDLDAAASALSSRR